MTEQSLNWRTLAASQDATVYGPQRIVCPTEELTEWRYMLGRLPHQPWLAPPSAQDHAAVEHALRTNLVWDWRGRMLGQLSGGEVLLMDQPLANLDPPHQTDWLLTVKALVAGGKTVVSVLHEVSFALQADALVVMAQGRATHQGRCGDAATHRALEAVFDQRIAVHQLAGQWLALPKL